MAHGRWSPAPLLHAFHDGAPHWFSSFFQDVRDASEVFHRDLLKVDGCCGAGFPARVCGGGTDMEQALMDARDAMRKVRRIAKGSVYTVGKGPTQEHEAAVYSQGAQDALDHLNKATAKLSNWETLADDGEDRGAAEKLEEAAATEAALKRVEAEDAAKAAEEAEARGSATTPGVLGMMSGGIGSAPVPRAPGLPMFMPRTSAGPSSPF